MASNGFELEVKRWSAWAPGLQNYADWKAWAEGARGIFGAVDPNVNFVERLLRRRLNPLNRMAFKVAESCMAGEMSRPVNVFCSRHGEFSRAVEILNNLASNETVSPTTFSLSVHNTSSSLYSIMNADNSHSSAIAGSEATLESGFLQCWSLLKEQSVAQDSDKNSALLVYCDQVLPDMFLEGNRSLSTENAALAFLMSLPEKQTNERLGKIKLSWHTSQETSQGTVDQNNSSALKLLKLLLSGGGSITINFGRLSWNWACEGTWSGTGNWEDNGL